MYVAATNYDCSGCALAVKPRAFSAPHAALGLDRDALLEAFRLAGIELFEEAGGRRGVRSGP